MTRQSTRKAFGDTLEELGADERIFVLDADVSKSTFTCCFARRYPKRFFNIGIAESNMLGVAAGIASCGNIVFACSFAMFAVLRACEQIRNTVCHANLNVKIVGTHAGLSAGADGASHHALEDIAILRSFPNMTIVCPADAVATRAAVRALANVPGPAYLRLRREEEPVLYREGDLKLQIGRAIVLRSGEDVTLVANGATVHTALAAADALALHGVSAGVIDMHTIKPLDQQAILTAARQTGAIVCCEEHSRYGGMGCAVSELLTAMHPVPANVVGTPDEFTRSGSWNELRHSFGISKGAIVESARAAIDLKRQHE